MQCAVTLLVLELLVAAEAHTVNYCGARMCGHGNSHTFCQYPPGPSSKCAGYVESGLSDEEKVRILARLNRRRSEAAAGRLRRMPSAGDMLKLRWVEDLAHEAQRWADQCRPPRTPEERDSCRDLYSISVGQCVASVVGESPGLRVESMVDLWYMQNLLYKENISSYVEPVSNVNYYGDFAQMIWSRSYLVGCGRTRFMINWNGRVRSVVRLVCNVGPRGPPPGRPLWAYAAPATACPPRARPDTDLPGLCSYQTDMDVATDVNNEMSIEEHVILSSVLEIENKESLRYLGSLDKLYLTKLAIVTMKDTVTESLLNINAIQKRDIMDSINLNGTVSDTLNTIMGNESTPLVNALLDDTNYTSSTVNPQVHTKQVITIGRPKAYQIEELNDIGGGQTTYENNNHETTEQEITKTVDRDLYLDYNEIFMTDVDSTISHTESSFSTADNVPLSSIVPQRYIDENLAMTSEITLTPIAINIKISKVEDKPDGIGAMNLSILAKNANVSFAPDDDYLNDPETVKDLQEALDRMEKNLEDKAVVPIKVRRDLGNPSTPKQTDQTYEVEEYRSQPEDLQNINHIAVVNNTMDRTPMLNMVLKYLPYLKPYEKDILGTSSVGKLELSVNYLVFNSLYFLL